MNESDVILFGMVFTPVLTPPVINLEHNVSVPANIKVKIVFNGVVSPLLLPYDLQQFLAIVYLILQQLIISEGSNPKKCISSRRDLKVNQTGFSN